MRISILGAGYVGIVQAVGMASHRHDVVLVEIDPRRMQLIKQGEAPMQEAGLEPLLKSVLGTKLQVTDKLSAKAADAEVIIICVQTNGRSEGTFELAHLEQATMDVAGILKGRNNYPVVVVKSTVIPGTTENTVRAILEKHSGEKTGAGFGLAVNPEFLREGKALEDWFHPDRIVIGEHDAASGDKVVAIYKEFDIPVIRVDLKTAEMIKCVSNAFLATKISYINEIGNICKRMGIDIGEIARGMSLDRRISPHFLEAGIGFGGSCLPKDTRALVSLAQELEYEPVLLESVLKLNEQQCLRLIHLAERKAGDLRNKIVAVLGLAFKKDTDDIRESPAIRVVMDLLERGASVSVYDPAAMDNARSFFGERVEYAGSAREAVASAEVVLVITDWDELNDPALFNGKIAIFGRNLDVIARLVNENSEGICW
ncbi:UDP-glucose dehydrogenase family protein [Chloroflexota bacterium]